MEHLLFPRGQIYSDTSQEWGGRCAFPIPHLSRPGSAPSSIHQGQPMPPRDQREQAIPPIPPWTRCVFQLAGAPADHLVWPPWNTCFALAHTRPLMPNGPPPPPPPHWVLLQHWDGSGAAAVGEAGEMDGSGPLCFCFVAHQQEGQLVGTRESAVGWQRARRSVRRADQGCLPSRRGSSHKTAGHQAS